ncbi:MAG: polysaccharide deacetylase family protein, partial [Cryomorphaceae bacterium]
RKDLTDLFCEEAIPQTVDDRSIEFDGKKFPILSIYGKSSLSIVDHNQIHLGSDIIGSTFFMLSRWEEAVITHRDNHDRFDYQSSLSVKMGFYQRPVVNEYVELLWELCRFLNPELKRVSRTYTCTLTSDIDELRKWKRPKLLFESLYLNLVKGRWRRTSIDLENFLKAKNNPEKDYYNNLDYLIRKSADLNAVFYLKTGHSHPKHDKNQYKLVDHAVELQRAESQGVELGIHPNYNTYLDSDQLKSDVEILESYLGHSIHSVRQHYLRFSVPETWRIQAEAGLRSDSTMIYPHRGGFRTGTCYSFPVFDFKADRQLDLIESPLQLMETSYLSSGFDLLIDDAKKLISEVKKYHGNFVFLWHNGNLVYPEDRTHFESLIDLAKPDSPIT